MAFDPLNDFKKEQFSFEGAQRDVYRLGSGPAVIVISEIPGITPKVAEFARRIETIGCTAVMPSLFGKPGRDPTESRLTGLGYILSTVSKVCVSKEFTLFARGHSSPVVDWLRGLAAAEHEKCGGPGVGVVGMCMTGGFGLAMAIDDRVLAAVMSQPASPVTLLRSQAGCVDVTSESMVRIRERAQSGDLNVIGLRFKSDRLVPHQRFRYLEKELGSAFKAWEFDDEDANPGALTPPHSVLTEHLIDEPGSRTRGALDAVLDLFRQRLVTPD